MRWHSVVFTRCHGALPDITILLHYAHLSARRGGVRKSLLSSTSYFFLLHLASKRVKLDRGVQRQHATETEFCSFTPS